jgi:hypothetical protein
MTVRTKRGILLIFWCLCLWGCKDDGKSGNDVNRPGDLGVVDVPSVSDLAQADSLAPDLKGEFEAVEPDESVPDVVEKATLFKDVANWSAFDAGNIDGLKTDGYFGIVFDGRYVYHVPCRDKTTFHARALRHDSQGDFKSADSWEAYDAAGTDDLITVGYGGGAFDGRYVYYAPFTHETSRHSQVLRYDTESGFKETGSWAAYDARETDNLKAMGYVDAVFDGRYVYFSPFGYKPFAHGRVLRFDTQGDFKASESWAMYEAGFTNGMKTKGYYGLVQEGQYIYFVPFNDGTEFHGRVLRYDTKGDFKEEASWAAYDAGNTAGMDTRGYKMAASDGRYVYFVPFRTSTAETHGRVLRYDSESPFEDSGSWDAYDAGEVDGLQTQAYVGAVFDGSYIYFCPYSYGAVDFHAMAMRYDPAGDFHLAKSWAAFEANPIDGLETIGYKGVVFDGRYVHFTPYHSGIALRFDTFNNR